MRGLGGQFSGFAASGEPSPDVFVNMGFAKLLTRLGPETFERFESLSAILGYLKKCVITSVLQQLRKPASEESDENQAVAFSANVEYEQILIRLRQLLPAPEDQRLADLRFRQDAKPAEIARAYPAIWPTARDVSVALQRILRVLRNSPSGAPGLGCRPTRRVGCDKPNEGGVYVRYKPAEYHDPL